MKRVAYLLIVLTIVCLFVACESNVEPTVSTNPMPAPPQPITFDDLEAAVAFIENPDFSNYREDRHSAYQNMVESFTSDGYMLTVSHKTATVEYCPVSLYPDVQYEDVGASFWFKLDGESYQVMLYNTRDGAEYTIDLETQDYSNYQVIRFGVSENAKFDRLTVNHPNISEMVLTTRNYHICAQSMIDATHYIVVTAVTDTDADTLKAFIEGLEIGKRLLQIDETSPTTESSTNP